jgi:hypothetical protein
MALCQYILSLVEKQEIKILVKTKQAGNSTQIFPYRQNVLTLSY